MKITRHPIDLKRITTVYQWRREHLEQDVEAVRAGRQWLSSFLGAMESLFYAGSVLNPNALEVGKALKLAAQAGTALFVLQRIEEPPRPFVLGWWPPVTYTQPTSNNCASFPTWMQVFNLCLITRESNLSDELCRVPNEVFRHSDLVGAAEADYSFADLLRAIWTQEHFTNAPAFARVEAESHQWAIGRTLASTRVRRITLPYLQALRKLEQRDSSGFAISLTEALEGHKEFWSSKDYCEEFNGFVSLELTAAAALAWDRGMRFDVDSDYLPSSWVRGDVFRDKN